MKQGKLILVLGTSSGSGKSTIATALCRILSDRGYKVAPFKAANMSRNSISIEDGSEIARAQWLQALASRTQPQKYMNPILLKPEGERRSQMILMGKSLGSLSLERYQEVMRNEGMIEVKKSLDHLLETFDVVVAEGAGSPAEVNLKRYDLSNSFILENYDPYGILVADIERGGVFASILGTIELMSNPEKLKGIVINKMRGEESLLKPGIEKIEERTGKEFIGILPFLGNIYLPGEDSLDYETEGLLDTRVCVVKYPFMENYSDLDPLVAFGIGFSYVVEKNKSIMNQSDLIILPGSKNVFKDIEFLKTSGIWDNIVKARNAGRKIVGICGGFQILGKAIKDPDGVQSAVPEYQGLGLLDSSFIYSRKKTTAKVSYSIRNAHFRCEGTREGYEIHYGSVLESREEAMNVTGGKGEGAISSDGKVIGTNIHGILENRCFINYLIGTRLEVDYEVILERNIDNLAKNVVEHLDISGMLDYVH